MRRQNFEIKTLWTHAILSKRNEDALEDRLKTVFSIISSFFFECAVLVHMGTELCWRSACVVAHFRIANTPIFGVYRTKESTQRLILFFYRDIMYLCDVVDASSISFKPAWQFVCSVQVWRRNDVLRFSNCIFIWIDKLLIIVHQPYQGISEYWTPFNSHNLKTRVSPDVLGQLKLNFEITRV